MDNLTKAEKERKFLEKSNISLGGEKSSTSFIRKSRRRNYGEEEDELFVIREEPFSG